MDVPTKTGMHGNLIGGEWVEGPDAIRDINPANTDDVVGEFSSADAAATERAIAAARAVFPAWSTSGIQQRFDILDRIGTEILERKEELGTLLSREGGGLEKPYGRHCEPAGAGEAIRSSKK